MSDPPSDHACAPQPAVAIPVHKPELSAAERLSLEHTVELLAGWPLFVIGPDRLGGSLDALCRRHGPRLGCKTYPDRYFASIGGYNALMRAKAFYESFGPYSHLLIAQLDALVLSDELEAWCRRGYSYIGAPWFVGGSEPRLPLEFWGVGNGGFSLRDIADFLRVLNTPRRIPNFIKSRAGGKAGITGLPRRIKHERCFAYNVEPLFPRSNEDHFWGILVPAVYLFFRVAPPEVALGFAFEAAPRLAYGLNGQRLPFGCHAWERYDRAFWTEQLAFLRNAAATSA